MTPEEIGQIYDQGRDAVIALVRHLFEIIADLQQQNDLLAERVSILTERVSILESRLSKDSHNSSKPPSSDGLKKPPPKSLRTSSGKSPGGQPGHPGATLCWSAEPDQVIAHVPDHCVHCGTTLCEAPSSVIERRQVHDLPPLQVVVTEHQIHTKVCPVCQHSTQANFPEGVEAPLQYGPHIHALGVYLTCFQLLPFARSSELLHDLFGVSLSEGTLSNAQTLCSERLTPVRDKIKATLIAARQAHFDETGVRIGGRLQWLHLAATPQLTYYAIHPKRGRAATEAIGILPFFTGRAIHDDWATYMTYKCLHGLCNSHHLRQLLFLAEEEGFLWAQAMKCLLQEMYQAVTQAQIRGQTSLDPLTLADFECRYQRLIEQGRAAHPAQPPSGKRGQVKQSAGYNLVKRLDLFRTSVLAFLYDFKAPFDNNLAERDIRMMKLRLKISGGFRTQSGADIFCGIRGYLSTMRKQGHNILRVLKELLSNHIILPMLQPE
jgi:transposase